MRRSLLLFLALAACARPQYRGAQSGVVLTVEGRVRGAPPIGFDAAGLAALEQRTVRGRDPLTGETAEYQGTSLAAVIRELEPKREVDLAVVHGSGGYAVAIPLPAIGQYRPVLAARAGGKPIADAVPGAGGFVLAWPNADAPGFDVDPRTRWWWVRDVTKIELVPWFMTYGRALRVPAGATDEARRGADRFATSCIQCHRLRDAGGARGPDLSNGIAPADRDRFVAAVRAHAGEVPEARGANLTRGLPEIVAFMEAVQLAGPLPPEEAPPEMKPPEELPPMAPLPPIAPARRGP